MCFRLRTLEQGHSPSPPPHPTPPHAASFPETHCDDRSVFLRGPELILEGPGPSSSSPVCCMSGTRADLCPNPDAGSLMRSRSVSGSWPILS